MVCAHQEGIFSVEKEHKSFPPHWEQFQVRTQIRVSSRGERYIAREVFDPEGKRLQDNLLYYSTNQEQVDVDWQRIVFDPGCKMGWLDWLQACWRRPFTLVERRKEFSSQPHINFKKIHCQFRIEDRATVFYGDGSMGLY